MRRTPFLALGLLATACGTPGDGTSMSTGPPASQARYEVSATVLESPDHGPQVCAGVDLPYPPQCSGADVVGWDWAGVDGEEATAGTTWGEFHLTGTWDGSSLTLTETPRPPRPTDSRGDVDFSTPCPEPSGGWRVVDEATTTEAALADAQQRAAGLPGFASLWLDQSIKPAATSPTRSEWEMNDPARLILNVRVSRDVPAAETELRAVWGGSLCVAPAERSLEELKSIQDEVNEDAPTSSSLDVQANAVGVGVWVADADRQAAYDARYGDGVVRQTGFLQPVDG